jgi:hypothetical protein
MSRKREDHNIRNIQKSHGTYYVTLPIEIVRALKWRERQKVTFKKSGKNIIISDWKKK